MAKEVTALFLENIKPGQKRLEIPDGRVPSMTWLIQPSGKISSAVRGTVDGKKVKHTIGAYPRIGIAEARQLAWPVKDLMARGINPLAAKKAEKAAKAPAAPTDDLVEDGVDEFLLRYGPNLKASTLHDVRRILHKDVVSTWRGRRLPEIHKKDIHRLLDGSPGYKPP